MRSKLGRVVCHARHEQNARAFGKTYRTGAASSYVLIAIVKKKLHLDASLYTVLQILSVSVLIYFDL